MLPNCCLTLSQLIPVSTYLGAYIIMTKYLKRRSDDVAKALLKTVSVESPAFYGNLPKAIVEKAIATTSELSISLWDSFLVELAKEPRIDKIYTIDEEMARKVKDLRIENPILTNVMKEYHQYIREK
jgi:predicted nucleic acid-binding protein